MIASSPDRIQPGAGQDPDHTGPQPAKIAYLVLAHADPEHFGRMLRRLADPRVAFFVHVDAKAKLAPFERAADRIANVSFVKNRVRVMWAAFSQVESTLRTIEAAYAATTPSCTHFVILSGADYPIAGNDEILARFASHPGRQFVRRYDILNCGDSRQFWRVKGYHFRELADRFTLRRRPLFVIEQALRLFPRQFPPSLTVAAGSNWCAFTRDCAAYCASFARGNPNFTKLFKFTFAPDEIFFHTIVQNSPFVNEAEPIEPYVDVTGPGGPWHYGNLHFLNPIVAIKTSEEAQAILNGRQGQLIARKFGSGVSAGALATIDAALDRLTEVGKAAETVIR